MVVTSLGGITGFFVGLGMKNSCGATGYTQIAEAGLGLFKISWGKYLKGSVIFGWLAFFFFLWFFYWLSTVVLCCMDRKFALIPKLT